MEQLRKVGQICRQHYEKLVLSLALLLLGGAVVYLYGASKDQAEIIRKIAVDYANKKVNAVKAVDLTNHFAALQRAEAGKAFDFSQPHHLFNPVQWRFNPGTAQPYIKMVMGDEAGPKAVTVAAARPYQLTVAFDRVASAGTGEQLVITGYWINSTNEAVLFNTSARGRNSHEILSLNATNTRSPVVLTEIKGSAQEPEELHAMLRETGEKFSFAPGRPFQKIIGYEASLRFPNATNATAFYRVGAPLEIDGQGYKIVDISTNEVKVTADSNEQPFIITNGAP